MVGGVLCTFMAFMASVYIYGLFSQERMESLSYVCDASKCCCKSLSIDLNGLSCFDPWKKKLIFNNTSLIIIVAH